MAVPGEELLRQRLRGGTGPFLREVVPFHANKFSVKSGWKDKESWGRWRWCGWAYSGTDYIWASGPFACQLTQSGLMGQSPGSLISWAVYFKESDSWHCYAPCFSQGAAFQVREQDGLRGVFEKGLGSVCSKSKYIQLCSSPKHVWKSTPKP